MRFEIKNGVLIKYNGNDETVTIPDGVTEIGERAFCDCKSLASVDIPDSVTKIDRAAFFYCSFLATVHIPKGVEEIGNCAFMFCSSLVTVHISDGVKTIGKSAFNGCKSLVSVHIPDSVAEIGRAAFLGCVSLKEATFSNCIKSIPVDVFEKCASLQCLVAPEIQIDVIKKAKLMQAATMGFLKNIELYTNEEIVAEYRRYASSQKKRLLPLILKDDNVKALVWYAENGKITKKNFETDFLNPAISANATQCVAYLLNWKTENLSDGTGDFKL